MTYIRRTPQDYPPAHRAFAEEAVRAPGTWIKIGTEPEGQRTELEYLRYEVRAMLNTLRRWPEDPLCSATMNGQFRLKIARGAGQGRVREGWILFLKYERGPTSLSELYQHTGPAKPSAQNFHNPAENVERLRKIRLTPGEG